VDWIQLHGAKMNFSEWKKEKDSTQDSLQNVSQEEFAKIANNYFAINLNIQKTGTFTEAVETSRYAVEVNYRTTAKEASEGFAKIALGYVSAALKNAGFHTKHVFTEKPLRLMVSTRNFDDGEWVGIVAWNQEHNCFVISQGFYNRLRKTVSVQNTKKCTGDNASDVAKELTNMVHHLKNQPDRHQDKLKPVRLQPGPKR